MIYLCPEEFPMTLAMSLAAVSGDVSQNRDRMSRACLATLCELGMYLAFEIETDFVRILSCLEGCLWSAKYSNHLL